MAKSVWRRCPDDFLGDDGGEGQCFLLEARGNAAPAVVLAFFEVPDAPPPPSGGNVTRPMMGLIG